MVYAISYEINLIFFSKSFVYLLVSSLNICCNILHCKIFPWTPRAAKLESGKAFKLVCKIRTFFFFFFLQKTQRIRNEGVERQDLQHLRIIKTEIRARKKNAIFFMSKSCSFNLLYSWTSNLVSICFCYVYLNISVFTICFCYVNIVYHVLCYIHARHHVLPWAKLEALNKKMHLNLKVSIFLIKTLSFD